MKLLAKTSLYYLILSIPILILSGFICYHIITAEVNDSNNELLKNRIVVVENYLKENDTVALNLITKSKEAQIGNTLKKQYVNGVKTKYSDTLILDKKENELAVNRMISSLVTIRNNNYQIKIWRSTIEYDELFDGIFYLLLVILCCLFLISMFVNFWVSKTLWKPFYLTVASLKRFRANDNQIPAFAKTSIKEFGELNNSLNAMMDKMIVDYNSQKKFTENASHEIQTPLAVIKSKIDLLIQSKNLQENEVKLIFAIDDACSKLIRLNKSLLLLTKIENRYFKTTEMVSFENIVDSSLVFFEDHIDANKIEITKNIESDFCVLMNPDLCLILVNNLLQNAIRHNSKGGKIEILMEKNKFVISNLGKNKPIDNQLFERFQKNTDSHESLGLGLSIAKEIAEVNGLSLDYLFSDGKHSFILSLAKNIDSK
ncbi:signal transduction histidine kinase [Flavobacterium sp. CG_9.10]|uniref:sensor histidine kinase n=1 Tax=Flavobacterium sp. CG_9.10 TaxID=2787729 RepID=UPI0018C92AC0|nr:HAMP domain-containing sensor histidine kinase [Flavobacterium sp. CG_9.10]MBG6110190.1 signal transduction histidine kinase [Flavobacterium sp. CG_9.10]